MLTERSLAWASLAPGLMVSAALAPKDAWFLSNFLFYWLSQLAVLGLVAAPGPRPAIIAGTASALALYLGSYGVWLFSRTPPESLAWLGYVCSLPGALAGVLGVALWMRRQELIPTGMATLSVGMATLVGIGLNQALVCSTVLYCA